MSDLGIYLLLFATFVCLIALIKLFSWLTLVQERGGFVTLIRGAIDRYVTVRPYHDMSSDTADDDDRAVSPAETNAETAETAQRVAEMQAESLPLGETAGETAALARLVAAGKVGLTDAVKIGAQAKSGEKYQRRSREIKAAVAQLQQRYPVPLTDDQAALREALELPPRR